MREDLISHEHLNSDRLSSDIKLWTNENSYNCNTLEDHWYTGIPYHWTNYNGTTLADAITQWSSSGNPEPICIIWTHCTTTGTTSTVGYHLNHTGRCYPPSGVPVAIPWYCKTPERPLACRWNHTGYQQIFRQWYSSVHWGLSSRHTGLPLDYN